MKEHPIIFSTDMVKAILDGRKTQTRRIIKPQPDNQLTGYSLLGTHCWRDENLNLDEKPYGNYTRCPYGQVGDRLWVKETHYRYGRWAKNGFTKIGKQAWQFVGTTDQIRYIDNPPEKIWDGWTREQLNSRGHSDWHKRPSIFMPRRASRITLEITGVRVERLHEIDYFGARAEGILSFNADHPDPTNDGMGYNRGASGLPMRYDSTVAFMDLWDSLNAERGYGWEVNPWVWPIEFKRVDNDKKND